MSKPEKVFRMGAVRASIFVNTTVQNGRSVALPKVIVEVRYRDKKTGKWQGTNSLSINDLPKAMSVLRQAYEYLLGSESEDEAEGDGKPMVSPAGSPRDFDSSNLDNDWPARG